jgi:hypothetical protein
MIASRRQTRHYYRCVMCNKRIARARAHVLTCSPRCRKRYNRWQKFDGPGPAAFGGAQVERD